MDEQLWDSLIYKTECELLQADKLEPIPTLTAPQLMNAHDVATFIEVTAQSHKCDPRDISFYYEPIIGDDGRVSLDELFLVFSMKSLIDGAIIDRAIHTIRVIVPQEVQQCARAMLKSQSTDRKSVV